MERAFFWRRLFQIQSGIYSLPCQNQRLFPLRYTKIIKGATKFLYSKEWILEANMRNIAFLFGEVAQLVRAQDS